MPQMGPTYGKPREGTECVVFRFHRQNRELHNALMMSDVGHDFTVKGGIVCPPWANGVRLLGRSRSALEGAGLSVSDPRPYHVMVRGCDQEDIMESLRLVPCSFSYSWPGWCRAMSFSRCCNERNVASPISRKRLVSVV